jgi:AAA domain
MITIRQHASFFDWQLRLQEESWLAYAGSRMKDLLATGKLFAGRLWGIQESNGMVILRFRRGEEPRMKTLWLLCLSGDTGNSPPAQWEFTYKAYRQSVSPRLSGKNTEVKTQYYLHAKDEDWSYIAVSGFDAGLLDELKAEYLDKHQHPLITLSETDPPVEYLIALRKYVSAHDVFQGKDLSGLEADRAPLFFSGAEDITTTLKDALCNERIVVVQGPPGTGKSYIAAELAEEYLKQGKNVVITALTNYSLAEIAGQPPLRVSTKEGRVYKSSLSADEQKRLSGLRPFTGALPGPGELLLISFYQMAVLYEQLTASLPLCDLLIIEEASQAFLATIAMFIPLGSKVLLIGDHMQLPPVVINRHDAVKIVTQADLIINGFSYLIRTSKNPAYLLTDTRRLAAAAAALTSLYYDSDLVSLADAVNNEPNKSPFLSLFHPKGGITKALYGINETDGHNRRIIKLCCQIAAALLDQDKTTETALLTPYASAETALYRAFSDLSAENPRLLISTVHKVQGITTDFTVLFLPLDNPSFELDDQLFNVATSRAKRGTLIIAPSHLNLVLNISPATAEFIKRSKDVSETFGDYLNQYFEK